MSMVANRDNILRGVGVLVTRPAHQAGNLCQAIEAAGGRAIPFPVLEIRDIEDTSHLTDTINRIEQFDIAIFISPNAVEKALNLLRNRGDIPTKLQIAAVGRTSAKALDKRGVKVDIFPAQRFDSEALLELDPLQNVDGKRIIIFRGEGGREVLAETLKARGAHVEYAECYRRAKPDTDPTPLMRLWARGEIHAVVITSGEGLRNLYDMVGQLGRQWLQKTQLFVASQRIGEVATELGFKLAPIVAINASDDAMLVSLFEWQKEQKGISKETL